MTHYKLKLSFDLRQVTQSLAYEFIQLDSPTSQEYEMEGGGPLAGTFNFQPGDTITVEVMATSAATTNTPGEKILKDFNVTNCTFVSVPARMTDDLSLFDPTSACIETGAWGPVINAQLPADKAHNLLRLHRELVSALPVKTKTGQWQISGYLSVELTPEDGPPQAQLYYFDPEASTGNGGGW